ncbi:MAG: SpoIID/LytB domain-containing protein, partial [Pyrinomonadaceae bacterium]
MRLYQKNIDWLSFLVVLLSAAGVAAASGMFATDTFALQLPTISANSAENVHFKLRDSMTGIAVKGRITTRSGAGVQRMFGTDDAGHGRSSLIPGRQDVEISAPGYKTLTTYFEVSVSLLDVTVWLDPDNTAPEMRAETTNRKTVPGNALIHGHVIDVETGKPVKGARLLLENSKSVVTSDVGGYFSVIVPSKTGVIPATDTLIVEIGGSPLYRRRNVILAEGASHFIIDIDRTAGLSKKDDTHKLMLPPDELRRTQGQETDRVRPSNAVDQSNAPAAVVVPASIRVGFNCPTKLTCSTVQVFPLDTYTRLGLDDEWFSSWHTNSLKAGAIANRSYGVWHVFNPLTTNYDICNTTSCQVIDPNDSAASCDLATAQTTGTIVVTSNGAGPFFAEYSAENNNGGCPDGFTGNNGSWPCLADPVDAGAAFNGHGRGMCQWGTQRWSINQGKDFVWIVNHYYNANGNPSGLRTGILQMSPNTILPPPTLTSPDGTAAPGTSVTTLTPT